MAGIANSTALSSSPGSGTLVLDVEDQKLTPPSLWSRIALGVIVLLSIFMNFFQLGENGYGNLYYASGIRSMTDSWHNFFFVSFDPGGFVTIDKPPVGFWLQALSAKIFGFTPFSIFLPQAVCGVLAVLLLYALIRRHFGVVAGLVAALVLAVTPISVVTNRNNTIDGTLAFVLLLAAWALIYAAETGKLRWLLLSACIVGVGFNIKMSEAYLLVPALGLTYLLCAPRKVWVRLVHLALALAVLLVISLSWAAIVDATPASQRPYVGSTQNNSEISLAFGYNGLNRIHISVPDTSGNRGSRSGGGGGSNFSPLRLFSTSYGGQIAWLLPFALLAMLALAWQRRLNFQRDRQHLALILWGIWLLIMTIFFTLDASFHQYYLTVMAPGLSAMVGIGFVVMWRDFRNGGVRGWLLPIALLVTMITQIAILSTFPGWSSILSPLIGIVVVLAVVGLVVYRAFPILMAWLGIVALTVGVCGLLIAPTIWSAYSVFKNVESSVPVAGPTGRDIYTTFGGIGIPAQSDQSTGADKATRGASAIARAVSLFLGSGGLSTRNEASLITYLKRHQGHDTFLVATPSSSTADAIILDTNKPVMAMGGFGGSDPILTTTGLKALIAKGTVNYFLMNTPRAIDGSAPAQYYSGRNPLSAWIAAYCEAVPQSKWTKQQTEASAMRVALYYCNNATGE